MKNKKIQNNNIENFSYGVITSLYRGNEINMGNYCSISKNVVAIGSGHHYEWVSTYPFLHNKKFLNRFNLKLDQKLNCANKYNIIIGNDVWIGYNVIFVGNVNVSDGCVIGSGSVVRGNFEPYSIIIGNPAKSIKKRFNDHQIKKLLEIKWWDWPIDKINKYSKLLCSNNIDLFIETIEKNKKGI